MLCNLHTHSTFCDGKNTPEEIILSAIEKGFYSIGFSGHSYADYCSYGMKDTDLYIAEITRLKEKYKNDIEIYLGIEEDMFHLTNRNKFEYIIGSNHYFKKGSQFYPIDLSLQHLKSALDDLYNGSVLKLAEDYYSSFCDYIIKRKPDIIGHFDLITKFDETDKPLFLKNEKYLELSKKYLLEALKADCIFEVNTGAISRGYRTTPYPWEDLLFELKKNDGKIMISSDSHSADTLDFKFSEMKKLLKSIGFTHNYILYKNEFTKVSL